MVEERYESIKGESIKGESIKGERVGNSSIYIIYYIHETKDNRTLLEER